MAGSFFVAVGLGWAHTENMRYVFLLFLFFTSPAFALEWTTGQFTQGGFAVGKATPGSKLMLGDETVKVAPDGTFVLGFERHFPKTAKLVATLPDGSTQTLTHAISKRTYKTQHIKGVPPKTVNPDPAEVTRAQTEAAEIKKARAPFTENLLPMGQFLRPAEGPFSGVYGSRRTYNGEERNWHKGLDIAAPTGTPAYTPADAKVSLVLPNTFFNGNMVVLDHGHQLFSVFCHLSRIDVKNGQNLKAGDLVGAIGATGRATGPHLHWGVYWRNMALDPALFLKEHE